jgi:ERCC4-type nuclease
MWLIPRRSELPGINDILIANIKEKDTPLIPLLEREGVAIKFTPLKLVDYIAAGKIAIIKRTMDEFVAELKNKMVYRTAIEFKRDFPDPLYIVEGKQTVDSSSANTVRAGITYLTVLNRIPIIFTDSAEDTSRYISLLLKQSEYAPEREEMPVAEVQPDERQPMEGNYQEQIVALIPSLTPGDAKALMDRFSNLKALFGASEADLKSIKSIGPKKAKILASIFVSPFRQALAAQQRTRVNPHPPRSQQRTRAHR